VSFKRLVDFGTKVVASIFVGSSFACEHHMVWFVLY
jgi:hypothetical protein